MTSSIVSSHSAQRPSILCIQVRFTCRGVQPFTALPFPSSTLTRGREPLFGLFKGCRPFNGHDCHRFWSHATGTDHRRCLRRGFHASLDTVSKHSTTLQHISCAQASESVLACLVQGEPHQAAGAVSDATLRLQNAQNALQKQQQRHQSSQPPANLQATKVPLQTQLSLPVIVCHL